MASLNTGQPMSSVPMVAVANDADVKLKCEASPKRHPTHCVNTKVWPVAITTLGALSRHRCSSSVVQIPARNLSSGRMNEPQSYRQPRRFSSVSCHGSRRRRRIKPMQGHSIGQHKKHRAFGRLPSCQAALAQDTAVRPQSIKSRRVTSATVKWAGLSTVAIRGRTVASTGALLGRRL